MYRTRFIAVIFLSLLYLGLSSAGVAGAATQTRPDPMEQLRPFVNEIVGILTDKDLAGKANCRKRRQRVMAAAHERFDFKEMSKRVLGREWRKLSPQQKEHFVTLFTKLLEHAYIGKIEDYSKQTVEFKRQRIRGNRAEVQTVLKEKNVTIPVSYIMILENGNQWMVYDIIVEGVSLVRNYMEQFREIVRQGGYSELIKLLENKIDTLEHDLSKTCPIDLPRKAAP
ncbi:Phospholipid ABC transporter shuttle protein MlaC [hydrothermal vent metagenome]|uniref:Phospholipid ABC transporter shuttle protein MlaC n=1 Tax=hydrothermal vent metagenome TaxID=652676 RepID=A0A3B0V8H6_9ZZZZ